MIDACFNIYIFDIGDVYKEVLEQAENFKKYAK